MSNDPCAALAAALPAMFECTPHTDGVRIRTAFMYPDGDYLDLYFIRDQEPPVVSDLGETVRWLRSQTLSPRRSPKQNQLIQDICLTHSVEFYAGRLQARVKDASQLAAAVLRVSQAALRVSDLWFTFRNRSIQSVADEVEDFLNDRGISYRRGERFVGRSGKTWPVDFHVRTSELTSLTCVLSTGSRSAARPIVNQAVATWYDLSHLRIGPEKLQFVSLFDDTSDVWAEEDYALVRDLSHTAFWSSRDRFADLLHGVPIPS